MRCWEFIQFFETHDELPTRLQATARLQRMMHTRIATTVYDGRS